MTLADAVHVTACRACGGATAVAFVTTVLRHHQVRFFKCLACESLQTEVPNWLPEAYGSAIAATDTGVMVRNLICHALVVVVATVLRVRGRLLDYGGGSGILCRMLRDHGFDAYTTDKYADPIIARPYSLPAERCSAGTFELISAVEVFEHWEFPQTEICRLFALRPRLVVATTQVYNGEGPDWWYLARETGQHIFFFSSRCLRELGREHGYSYFGTSAAHIFSLQPLTVFERTALRVLLSGFGLGVTRVILAASLRGTYANKDHRAEARADGTAPPMQ